MTIDEFKILQTTLDWMEYATQFQVSLTVMVLPQISRSVVGAKLLERKLDFTLVSCDQNPTTSGDCLCICRNTFFEEPLPVEWLNNSTSYMNP